MANQEKMSTWDKVIKWYAGHAYAVNIIYSLGASVVIVGALFKILHWPGASQVLMVGMFTESFLFILGIFEKPHASYHWENVFPQLIGEEAKELVGGNGNTPINETKVNALDDAEVKRLNEGIAGLSKAAEQLTKLSDVATAGNQLTSKMNAAGEAADKFVQSQTSLAGSAEKLGTQYQTVIAGVETAAEQTKAFGKGIEQVNAQLASLNSVYELQLKSVEAQAAALKQQAEKLAAVNKTYDAMGEQTTEMQKTAATAVAAAQQYVAAQKKLAEQVADLNKVYGNMLNAVA